MAWSGVEWELVEPATVCRVAPVSTAVDARRDLEVFATERELYARGYLWCECFTIICPDGERGHIQELRLLALSRSEFDAARRAIDHGDECVLERWLTYRVDAARHDLPSPDMVTPRDRATTPSTLLDGHRCPSRDTACGISPR